MIANSFTAEARQISAMSKHIFLQAVRVSIKVYSWHPLFPNFERHIHICGLFSCSRVSCPPRIHGRRKKHTHTRSRALTYRSCSESDHPPGDRTGRSLLGQQLPEDTRSSSPSLPRLLTPPIDDNAGTGLDPTNLI